MKKYFYGHQTIDDDDINAVVEVLRSDMLTQGAKVIEFEEALAGKCGAKYAVACSSGTAALHLSYMALDLAPEDIVVTSANTFASTMNTALFSGATPLFIDIDPETYNMNAALLSEALKEGPKPKAVVPVHFAGLPIDMEELSAVARAKGAYVIEDACHALGASWTSSDKLERRVGDSAFSDMTVFSFHPVKSITTGEGGAILTNDAALYDRLKSFRTHGITKDAARFENSDIALLDKTKEPASWYYEMKALGLNYRITDFQCALGLSQLRKLDKFMQERARVARKYDSLFAGFPYITRRGAGPGKISANHLYVVKVPFDEHGIDKAIWFKEMAEKGIMLQVHYIPVHLQPYYRKKFSFAPGDLPNVEQYYKRAISLPIYPGLTDSDLDYIAGTIMESLKVKFN